MLALDNRHEIDSIGCDADTVPISPAPSITVCLCTHDRPGYARTCLAGLRHQTVGLDAFDTVVVDSCSGPAAAADLVAMVAALPNARLVRLEELGISRARNAAARASGADYVAYIDDDAIPAPDWIERIRLAIIEAPRAPAVLSGRVLPIWEAPLPDWWPASLRGVLSIVEWNGRGEYRTPQVPQGLEPYGVNMVVDRAAMLALGGFDERLGRVGNVLLSDEDIQLAWRLQDLGRAVQYDARIVVHHQIQARRLTPEWLIERLYCQGASTVVTRRLLGQHGLVRREFPRRLMVEALCEVASLVPMSSSLLIALRWRLAYARGFTRMALGCHPRKRSLLLQARRLQIRKTENKPSVSQSPKST